MPLFAPDGPLIERESDELIQGERQFPWIEGSSEEDERTIKHISELDMQYQDSVARLHLVFGLRGSGKSLFAIVWASILRHMTKLRVGRDLTVMSNIWTDIANYCDPNVWHNAANPLNPQYKDLVLIWDEVGEAMIGKRSTAGVVVAQESSLAMMRKRNINVLATTQWPHVLTGLFQLQCDLLIRPTLHKEYYEMGGKRYIKAAMHIRVWNYNGSITGRSLVGLSVHELPEPDMQFTLYGVEHFFKHYDTTEVVISPHTAWGKKLIEENEARQEVLNDVFRQQPSLDVETFVERFTPYLDLTDAFGNQKFPDQESVIAYALEVAQGIKLEVTSQGVYRPG